jgi:hypothetical protein
MSAEMDYDEPDAPSRHTKLTIQHVAKNHPEWMITPQGQAWVEEINQKVDAGWFCMTSSFALAHQPSVCPVCSRQSLEAPPISGGSTCASASRRPPDSLLVAILHNDIQQLQVLLQDPSRLRQIDDGPGDTGRGFADERSPLYHAVRNDQPDIVRLLLQARANAHKQIWWKPGRADRPLVSTTPYRAVQVHQDRIKDVFNEVLWSGAPPPPPPLPPLTRIPLTNGGFLWT